MAHGQSPFVFRDAGDETGLFPAVGGIAGHGVGWGDVDGNGWPDLYVGTFGGDPYGSKPNQLFLNDGGKFTLDDQQHLRVLGRANCAIFVDFDNDGDLDLYATNHAIQGRREGQQHYSEPNHLFRNDGGGKFTDVSKESGCCPEGIAARNAAALDFDGDGLLDLAVGECFFQGGMSRSRLYRNLGGLKFENVSQAVGLPEELTGFGVAAGDVNGDTWPDLFFAGRHHGNRLFVSDGKGKYRSVPKSHADFTWEYTDTPDDTTCGVCYGDLNRDGRQDLVVGSHFARPWFTGGVPVRLYLNRGNDDTGLPRFEDVTERAGLIPLPLKSPHVEVQDFDNDGLMDIYTSIVKFASDGTPHPVIFRNEGVKAGLPQFRESALAVNDFPTAEDKAIAGSGEFFEKVEKEHKIIYMAPRPERRLQPRRPARFVPRQLVGHAALALAEERKRVGQLDRRDRQGRRLVQHAGDWLARARVPAGHARQTGWADRRQGDRRRLRLCLGTRGGRPLRTWQARRVRHRSDPAARQGQAGIERREGEPALDDVCGSSRETIQSVERGNHRTVPVRLTDTAARAALVEAAWSGARPAAAGILSVCRRPLPVPRRRWDTDRAALPRNAAFEGRPVRTSAASCRGNR
jgi:hypothetical protein